MQKYSRKSGVNKSAVALAALAAYVIGNSCTAIAAGGNWTNASGGSWQTGSNWSTGSQPNSVTSAVFVPNSTYTVNISTAASARNMDVNAGNATFNFVSGGSLNLAGTTAGTDRLYIARNSGQSATLTIQGGNVNYNADRVSVGSFGNGSLRVVGAGSLHINNTNGILIIGGGQGGNGNATLLVDGTGSNVVLSSEVAVGGDNSTGTATVSNGATITSGYVDGGSAGHSTITVKDSGSRWTANGNWYIGGSDVASNGNADSLNIQSGGLVEVTGTTKVWNNNAQINLAGGTLRTGSLSTVSLSNFIWTSGTLDITGANFPIAGPGPLGSSLTLGSGKTFKTSNGGDIELAQTSGTSGTVTLSGGALDISGYEYIGEHGPGVVNQSAGSNSAQKIYLGFFADGNGQLNASGGTVDTQNLYIGGSQNSAGGTGSLTVSGAAVTVAGVTKVWNTGTNAINLSSGTLKTGALDLDGGASRLNWTSGTLELTGSGTVIIGDTSASTNTFATNSVSLGTGKTLRVTNSSTRLVVGNNTQGTMTIQSGAAVNVPLVVISDGSGGSGAMTIDGAGSSLNATQGIVIGNSSNTAGNTAMVIQAGANVSTANMDVIGRSSVANTGGSLTVDNATLAASGGLTIGNTAASNAGSASVQIQNGANVTVNGTTLIHPNGALNISGGTLSTQNLNVSNAGTFGFTGGTIAISGTLTPKTSGFVVPTNGALIGTGSVAGNMTSLGMIQPGSSSIGTLAINGNFQTSSSSTLAIDINGVSTSDQVNVTSTANLAGNLQLNFGSGYTPAVGDSHTIFQAGVLNGSFSNLPDGGSTTIGGKLYQAQYNRAAGTIAITRLSDPTTIAPTGTSNDWSSAVGGTNQTTTNVSLASASNYTLTVAQPSTANRLEVSAGSPTLDLGANQLTLNESLRVGSGAQSTTLNIPTGTVIAKTGVTIAPNAVLNAGAGASIQTSNTFTIAAGADLGGGDVNGAPTTIVADKVVIDGSMSNENIEITTSNLTLANGATLGGVITPTPEMTFAAGRTIYGYDGDGNPILSPIPTQGNAQAMFAPAAKRPVQKKTTVKPGPFDPSLAISPGTGTSGKTTITAKPITTDDINQFVLKKLRFLISAGQNASGDAIVSLAPGLNPGGVYSAPTIDAPPPPVDPGLSGWEFEIADGGILAPGDGFGTISVDGNVTLHDASILQFELGSPGMVGNNTNDLVTVINSLSLTNTGNLTLDGILQVEAEPGFGAGTYTLFTYAGTLQDNLLQLNSSNLPVGYDYAIDTSTSGAVNLLVTAVPEPTTLAFLGMSAMGLLCRRRRRREA